MQIHWMAPVVLANWLIKYLFIAITPAICLIIRKSTDTPNAQIPSAGKKLLTFINY